MTRVQHVRQAHTWDCGLACLEMALTAVGAPHHSCNLTALKTRVAHHAPGWKTDTNAIWTVDLAYLLKSFHVRFKYLTATIGVDPDLKNQTFYQSTIRDDESRVNSLFKRAALSGVTIAHASLTQRELRRLLRPHAATSAPEASVAEHMVIALVDRRWLYHGQLGWGAGLFEHTFRWLSSALGRGRFIGHYVLLIDYVADADAFLILDPSGKSEPICVRADNLDAARLSYGTDEDLLVIPVAQTFSGELDSGASTGP